MDFYTILEIENDATIDEIKKAYRRLVVKYHPDKNSEPNSIDKFRDIQTAYEVLIDEDRRAHYDLMTECEKYELYTLIKKYIPDYLKIINTISNSHYKNENELKDDISNLVFFKKIYNKIIHKFSNTESDDIIIRTTLKEVYLNETTSITHNDATFTIPLTATEIKLDDISVKIICEDDDDYTQLHEHDLFIVQNISLSQYLYGSNYQLVLPNDDIFEFDFGSLIDKVPILKFSDKGLPINNINDYSESEQIYRGDLYVYFKIDGINSLCLTEIDDQYGEAIKIFLIESFPNITESSDNLLTY